ncbi:MAG: hypothetical protein ACJAVT_001900 [Yoonia sp.]|jgi:hypothetical protein
MFMTILKITGAILLALVALVGCQTVRHSGQQALGRSSRQNAARGHL